MARVLIVDDHPDHCTLLMLLFAHGGHQASCVESVEAALEFMLGQKIDLLITDVMMPGIDGLELLGMIRRTQASRFLPVVVFSALSDPEFQRYAISKGANDYLVKGTTDIAEVERRLAKYLKPMAAIGADCGDAD